MPAPNTPNDLASALAARWESQFAKLVAFQQRHGHCRVPVIRQEDRVLSNWVNSQRSAWRNGVLKPDRRQRLEQIGFNGQDRRQDRISWETRFAQLVAFQSRFGHCRVPAQWSEEPGLANWVIKQRKLWKCELLDPEQIRRLEELGFKLQSRVKMKYAAWLHQPPGRTTSPQLKALNRLWEKQLAVWRQA